MSYDPKDLRLGDLILTVGRERLSLAGALDLGIEGATDCPFDHCAMVGEGVLLEQLITMTASPLDKYTENGWRYSIPATADQRAAAVAWMKARVGAPYGIGELLDDAARDLLHLPLWPKGHPKADARYTCSGSAVMAYLQAGYPLTWAPWPSPADLSYSPLLFGTRPWGQGDTTSSKSILPSAKPANDGGPVR